MGHVWLEVERVSYCDSLAEQIRDQLFLIGVDISPEQARMVAMHVEQPKCETCVCWEQYLLDNEQGLCTNEKVQKALDLRSPPETSRCFGCIYHEECKTSTKDSEEVKP